MTAIFRATHRITLDSGETQEVMLDDGRAYTREEWDAADASDYERTEDGSWLFQGQPFNGTVREMTDADNVVCCSVTREGNTWYVFSDDGEMLASGPGRVSAIEDLWVTLRSRGVSRASVDGLFVDVPEAAS